MENVTRIPLPSGEQFAVVILGLAIVAAVCYVVSRGGVAKAHLRAWGIELGISATSRHSRKGK